MNLGKNIKSLRIQKGMTQEELAELLCTTSKSISRWEQDLTYPDITLLPFIANIFEITVDELLGVDTIKQDEYVKELKDKAYALARNNDYEGELLLWQKAYQQLPNNDEIKICLINIMNTINIIKNKVIYKNEIIKFAEGILTKSTNNLIRLEATQILVDLYSQMENLEMAEYYTKQLPSDITISRNVMKTRYLKDQDLLTLIQCNISDFFSEINRESEFIIYDNRMNTTAAYKKGYLERLVKIEELLFVKDNDYGYESVPLIFNYIKLIKLEINTTNNEKLIKEYLNRITKLADYIINFIPHVMKSPFVNTIECKTICGYSSVLSNLPENILKEINDDDFNQYKDSGEYNNLLIKIKMLKNN